MATSPRARRSTPAAISVNVQRRSRKQIASRVPHRRAAFSGSAPSVVFSNQSPNANVTAAASPAASGPCAEPARTTSDALGRQPSQGRKDLVADQAHAGQRVAERHAAPLGAQEEEVDAELFPARPELLPAFLGAAQHEA